MNELNKINNEDFLKELSERLDKGEIKFEGGKLVMKMEERKGGYFSFAVNLNIDVGKLVNKVIRELEEEKRVIRQDGERAELRLAEYKKQLKIGYSL